MKRKTYLTNCTYISFLSTYTVYSLSYHIIRDYQYYGNEITSTMEMSFPVLWK